MAIGIYLYITIDSDEIVDAELLQKVMDFDIETARKGDCYHLYDIEGFSNDLWNFRSYDKKSSKKIIDYMKQNNFMIAPGRYTFNPIWLFDNGKFIYGGKKFEIFKFKTKPCMDKT